MSDQPKQDIQTPQSIKHHPFNHLEAQQKAVEELSDEQLDNLVTGGNLTNAVHNAGMSAETLYTASREHGDSVPKSLLNGADGIVAGAKYGYLNKEYLTYDQSMTYARNAVK